METKLLVTAAAQLVMRSQDGNVMDLLLRHAILFAEMVFELQMRNAITSLTMLDVMQVANQLTHNGHVLEMLE